MRIVIVGAGSVGRTIAREMTARGHDVAIVDRDPKAMRIASVPAADWILADACEVSTLEQAELDNTDVVVTTTGDDKANLVVSLLAKTEFGVPRVISRINNPANAWLFDESWGVDVPVSTPQIMTTLIEEAVSSGEFILRLDFHATGTALYQGTVARDSRIAGSVLGELILPSDSFVSAILRDNTALAPDPDIRIVDGDQLLVIVPGSDPTILAALNALIAPPVAEDSEA